MQIINRKREIGYSPILLGKEVENLSIEKIESTPSKEIYLLQVPKSKTEAPLTVKWKMKALRAKGSWTSNAILDKRFRTDWEMPQIDASISVDAPILSLFDHEDNNLITVACSDPVNNIQFEGALREEDNHFYFSLYFFNGWSFKKDYSVKIIIDKTKVNFSHTIQSTASWILSESETKISPTPKLAKVPLYSTWYSFHQQLEEDKLLEECKLSKSLGCDLIIIDDGWQTLDEGRGYDYTGDWEPDRFPDISSFVQKVHDLDMAIMLWYSVPFCGKKSKAYQRFKGKFLTENHHWAPVFDPRFPEVRAYLVNTYKRALIDWNIDGFKLDFIDDFKIYPETETKKLEGRDTLSVSEGTKKLISEISQTLKAIKEDILVEFRQQYVSPSLQELGNMFRAFDCPNDSLMNRVRTTDVKLICGKSAVHSDMITWHKQEELEIAALQFTSLIFSVPQISILLSERSKAEIEFLKFYTQYWIENKDILLDGTFTAFKPLSNYPILSAERNQQIIYGIYEDVILPISTDCPSIHIINGKTTSSIVIRNNNNKLDWKMQIVNCKGELQKKEHVTIEIGINEFICPPNGIIFLKK